MEITHDQVNKGIISVAKPARFKIVAKDSWLNASILCGLLGCSNWQSNVNAYFLDRKKMHLLTYVF